MLTGHSTRKYEKTSQPTQSAEKVLFVKMRNHEKFFRGLLKRYTMIKEGVIEPETAWEVVVQTQQYLSGKYPDLTVSGGSRA